MAEECVYFYVEYVTIHRINLWTTFKGQNNAENTFNFVTYHTGQHATKAPHVQRVIIFLRMKGINKVMPQPDWKKMAEAATESSSKHKEWA